MPHLVPYLVPRLFALALQNSLSPLFPERLVEVLPHMLSDFSPPVLVQLTVLLDGEDRGIRLAGVRLAEEEDWDAALDGALLTLSGRISEALRPGPEEG